MSPKTKPAKAAGMKPARLDDPLQLAKRGLVLDRICHQTAQHQEVLKPRLLQQGRLGERALQLAQASCQVSLVQLDGRGQGPRRCRAQFCHSGGWSFHVLRKLQQGLKPELCRDVSCLESGAISLIQQALSHPFALQLASPYFEDL